MRFVLTSSNHEVKIINASVDFARFARLPSALEIHVYLYPSVSLWHVNVHVCTVLMYFVNTVNPAECVLQSVGNTPTWLSILSSRLL